MTAADGLEDAYRRLLRWWYPLSYRQEHEEEILGVLMDAARPGQRRPRAGEVLDLLWWSLKVRIRTVLRGADSPDWAAALALAGVLIPLLMVLLKLTVFLYESARYGFGTPADILIGAYGNPGAYARNFQLNPSSVAVAGSAADALTAGPLPALILAALALKGWRHAAAAFAALVPLAYLGIALIEGYTLLNGLRTDVALYAYGLAALILFIAPDTAQGWRALRWRPSALLATATVAAGVGLNGGFLPGLGYNFPNPYAHFWNPAHIRNYAFPDHVQHWLAVDPPGWVGQQYAFGPVPGGWGVWLVHQGPLLGVIAVALLIMWRSPPVNRRVLLLLAIPFALGSVDYVWNPVISPPLAGRAGNALAIMPLLLIMVAAIVLRLVPRPPADPGASPA